MPQMQGPPPSNFRHVIRAEVAKKDQFPQLRKISLLAKSKYGIQLRLGGILLKDNFDQRNLSLYVSKKWGSASNLETVIGTIKDGQLVGNFVRDLAVFQNSYKNAIKETGSELKDLGLVVDVPESSKRGSWRTPLLYACIVSLVDEISVLHEIDFTFGNKVLSGQHIRLTKVVSESNAERVFLACARMLLRLSNGDITSSRPVALEPFLL